MKKILWSCAIAERSELGTQQFIVTAQLGNFKVNRIVFERELSRFAKQIFTCMTLELRTCNPNSYAVEVLRQAVESNKRYVAQTGRTSEAVVLHPDHAAALLELLK